MSAGSPECCARHAAAIEAQLIEHLVAEAERCGDAAGVLDGLARLRDLDIELRSVDLDAVLSAYYRGVEA
jgi:hypothetical protein